MKEGEDAFQSAGNASFGAELLDVDVCPDCGVNMRGELGLYPFPCKGAGHRDGGYFGGSAQFHGEDTTVYLEHPKTGKIIIPGTNGPMHPNYVNQGYERKELRNLAEVRKLEKRTGMLSERASLESKNSHHAEKAIGAV